jgi:transposase
MNLHLLEISQAVAPGAHAVLLMDQAGWHTSDRLMVSTNITIVLLPPRSPELNPVETSGSSCATTGSRTGCSRLQTTS